jgi:ABC-type protease/lipase transport system fused ATPase/permease subunit
MMQYVVYSLWFWIGLVAVIAIVAGVVTNAVNKGNETKRYVADAANGGSYKKLAEDTAAVNAELLTRLGAVEQRLGSIEKTLTDIP